MSIINNELMVVLRDDQEMRMALFSQRDGTNLSGHITLNNTIN